MDGNKRRQAIIDILKNSLQPVSGTYLAKTLQVSRQVIVQDIALLRAGDYDNRKKEDCQDGSVCNPVKKAQKYRPGFQRPPGHPYPAGRI